MKDEKKQEEISIGERYAKVAQLRREGILPTPSDDISPEISAKVLESLKETFGKKESQ